MIADMSATRQHPADTHDRIRVRGARQNNLKDISVELPKRRLTVFTGVSGSGKSFLVPARGYRGGGAAEQDTRRGKMETVGRVPAVGARLIDCLEFGRSTVVGILAAAARW